MEASETVEGSSVGRHSSPEVERHTAEADSLKYKKISADHRPFPFAEAKWTCSKNRKDPTRGRREVSKDNRETLFEHYDAAGRENTGSDSRKTIRLWRPHSRDESIPVERINRNQIIGASKGPRTVQSFQLGGDDVPYNWLTVYFSDLLSPMTVLALTS